MVMQSFAVSTRVQRRNLRTKVVAIIYSAAFVHTHTHARIILHMIYLNRLARCSLVRIILSLSSFFFLAHARTHARTHARSFLRRLYRQIPHRYADAAAEGMPFRNLPYPQKSNIMLYIQTTPVCLTFDLKCIARMLHQCPVFILCATCPLRQN